MVNIYSYLKNVWQKESGDFQNNPFPYFVLFVFLTIPLPYIFSSIASLLLVGYALFFLRRSTFHNAKALWFPVLLYVGIVVSYFWTIDTQLTLSALSKQIPLLFFPLVFFWNPIDTEYSGQKIKNGLALGYSFYALYWLLRAIIRFYITRDSNVFFYHELVTNDLNAIHVSFYLALVFFIILEMKQWARWHYVALGLLSVCLVLLSSKNILIVFGILAISRLYFLFRQQLTVRVKVGLIIGLALIGVVFSGKIKERFFIEISSNTEQVSVNHELGNATEKVYNVSVQEAWNQPTFKTNDFFPGTALRVYQLRIFKEMMEEDGRWFTGYGANATDSKIQQKRIEHHLYEGYDVFNFHNQYIQFFAEIGIFGFIICILMVLVNLKNAIIRKDFVHFSFAILIISLFLTESLLARQRGVLFFTLLYCCFNSFAQKETKK